MSIVDWNALLDAPLPPASFYGQQADRLAKILGTENDVLLVQGEAIVALEAVAVSVARPGLKAINVVTSLYGGLFGEWLRRGGAEVTDLQAEPGKPITVEAVAAALAAQPDTKVLALVHAESATGILNPLADIAALAKARGIVLIVDAVASVGGHALAVDQLGIDIAVIGPQKSLGGSAGLSALSVSKAAWALIEATGAPTQSVLSLLDLKTNWLDKGRPALPGMPSAIEFRALAAALDRVESEGLASLIARHALAASATREAIRALGLELWVEPEDASNLVTGVIVPPDIAMPDLLAALEPYNTEIGAVIGSVSDRVVRLNHTGPRARFDIALANVLALGQALASLGAGVDLGAAAHSITEAYGARA